MTVYRQFQVNAMTSCSTVTQVYQEGESIRSFVFELLT